MVMVTHDEHMKQYANRIFNIIDGKVSKMHIVPNHVRENAVLKLRDQLAEYEKGNDGVGVRMGIEVQNAQKDDFNETRSPMDYPFVKYMVNKINAGG